MDRRKRLRRVALLCIHFTRNLAFFRALSDSKPDHKEGDFWITVKGDCLDIAVLEWCKLFAEQKGKHAWQKICADQDQFQTHLIAKTGITKDEWDQCCIELWKYRNKFVAHLDDDHTMQIPKMSAPMETAAYYYDYVKGLDEGSFFIGFPPDLHTYYAECYQMALDATKK